MARLLVSVRSAEEAREALRGGAAVIDVKEPDRGPLGRADFAVWSEVRRVVPRGTPSASRLGELNEWLPATAPLQNGVEKTPLAEQHDPDRYRGFSFRKLGLAGVGSNWKEHWARLRECCGVGPAWVAVIYSDWERAGAPHPHEVLEVALSSEDCGGLMIDTWDKTRPGAIERSWHDWIDHARSAGRLTAIAGSINALTIAGLRLLRPDIVAVRGAACRDGDRRKPVDALRVAELAAAAATI
ncbi:MAG: (5-formylfuran-3-yl)methyl phosphate synthase [Isosphaeraceae bacterium]